MALVLNITDGTNTVNLAGTDAYCLDFGLDTPMGSQEYAQDSYEEQFFGTNSTISANISELHTLFHQARRRNKSGKGPRVFLQAQLDGSNTYRSEVIDGSFSRTPEMVQHERATGSQKGTLNIVRVNGWDGAEAALNLTNPNGTNQTSVQVYNNNDGTSSSPTDKDNYADISSTVLGDLPCGARINYAFSASGGTIPWMATIMGIYDSAPGVPVYDEMPAGSGTPVSIGTRTGGSYQSVAAGGGTVTIANNTPLGTALFNYCSGIGAYKFMVSMAFSAAGSYKLTPYFGNGTTNYYGPSQYVSGTTAFQLFDLGIVNFPPTPHVVGNSGNFYGYVKIESVGSGSIYTDWLMIARCDFYRRIDYQRAFYTLSGAGFMYRDDSIDTFSAYEYDTGTSKYTLYLPARGSQIMLQPGKYHRFHWAMGDQSTTSVTISDGCTIGVTYRPPDI